METMNIWGVAAQDYWRRHRPRSMEALADPEGFFTELGQDAAARYLVIRDSLLEGVNPNNGSIGWAEFQDKVAKADQKAREIVETEMIYLPPGEMDETAGSSDG